MEKDSFECNFDDMKSKQIRGKKCIGFGDMEKKCNNKVDEEINPIWCPTCNKKRIKYIDKQLDKLIKNFPKTYKK